MMKFISQSEKETMDLAQRLAKKLSSCDCLALVGDFGSGKTTFVKGLAAGLGFKKKSYVTSPSFVILKIYRARLPLYHFDLYRLKSLKDMESAGLGEFTEARGISVIEWADRCLDFLPPGHLKLEFSVLGPNRRAIKFTTKNKRLIGVLKKCKI